MSTPRRPPPDPRLPPGWPQQVLGPGHPDLAASATAWLLDICPPEYRDHDVLRRNPLALAHLALEQVRGSGEATRRALGSARAALAEDLPPQTVEQVLDALEGELARLRTRYRQVVLVTDALRGQIYVPRL